MKNFLLVVVLLVSVISFSQNLDAEVDTYDASPFVLEHVSVSVKDVDKSAAFYLNVFGISEIVNRGEAVGVRWFSLGQGRELHLISIVPGEVKLNKALHFAVTARDFSGFVSRLQEANVPYSDWNGTANGIALRPDGVKQVYVQDPDGNWIEINSTRPKD